MERLTNVIPLFASRPTRAKCLRCLCVMLPEQYPTHRCIPDTDRRRQAMIAGHPSMYGRTPGGVA